MNDHKQHLNHARALRADILGSPDVWLPRRDAVLEWLNGFLLRAAQPRYELGDSEASDLVALDQFLRKKHVPAA
jgi:hypothetical protein